MSSLLILFLAGFAGAFLKDILEDNKLKIPRCFNGELDLGFIGGCLIGAAAGYLVDTSPAMAFAAGYAGTGIVESLILGKKTADYSDASVIEAIIRQTAKEECVDPDLAVRVAKCESKLNYKAINVNPQGSRDRGIYQINDKYHPEITDEQAFDPVAATHFFCKAFKEGNLGWWKATQKCWQK